MEQLKNKAVEIFTAGKKKLTELVGKLLAGAGNFFSSFSDWYEKQEETIQELTSILVALLLALMLRILIVGL